MKCITIGKNYKKDFEGKIIERSLINKDYKNYIHNDSKNSSIAYQVNILVDDPNIPGNYSYSNSWIEEQFDNLFDALIRMYNLKVADIFNCDLSVIVKRGNKELIIDESVNVEYFYRLINTDTKILKLAAENEQLKLELKLYKEFIKKYKCENTFNEFVKENK